jgi:hypothetical protein
VGRINRVEVQVEVGIIVTPYSKFNKKKKELGAWFKQLNACLASTKPFKK